MRRDLIRRDLICLDWHVQDQSEFFDRMVEVLLAGGYVRETFRQALGRRESTYPTALPTAPEAVAIPHSDADHHHRRAHRPHEGQGRGLGRDHPGRGLLRDDDAHQLHDRGNHPGRAGHVGDRRRRPADHRRRLDHDVDHLLVLALRLPHVPAGHRDQHPPHRLQAHGDFQRRPVERLGQDLHGRRGLLDHLLGVGGLRRRRRPGGLRAQDRRLPPAPRRDDDGHPRGDHHPPHGLPGGPDVPDRLAAAQDPGPGPLLQRGRPARQGGDLRREPHSRVHPRGPLRRPGPLRRRRRKRFNDRQLYVGLDWPFLGGANEIWLAVIWRIPVTLAFAFVLPGNGILPFAGIINICVAVAAYFASQGNIIRMLIQCTIFAPVFLWAGTAFAPFMTDLANSTKAVDLAEGQLISKSSIDAPIFTYALSHLLQIIDGNVVPLLIFVVWRACFVLYSRALIKERDEARAQAAATD